MSTDHALIETLTKNLAQPISKAVGHMFFGEIGAAAGGGIGAIINAKVSDYYARRELSRRLDSLAEKIVESLLPIFEDTAEATKAIEPISLQLAPAVLHIANSNYLIGQNLDPQLILKDVRQQFPLPKNQHTELECQLYERALERLVRCLIEISPTLPHFTTESVAKALQQFSAFVDEFDDVAKRVERIEEAAQYFLKHLSGEAESHRQFEIDYRLAVARQADYLELFGADIAPESRKHELSVAYVTLSLDSGPANNRSEYTSFDTILTKLASQKRSCLLLRGEAGGGKSTLFRWAALATSNITDPELRKVNGGDATQPESNVSVAQTDAPSWQARVPFLVRLRDCQDGLPPARDLASHCVTTLGREPPNWTTGVLSSGRALVLLDGVDEVPNFQRQTMAQQIEALVKQYPANIYLVSTRPSAVPDGWLSHAGFAEARVNPLGEQDKIELIENWHRAVAKELFIATGREVDLSDKVSSLRQLVRENASISRLATNPLLCAMICALHHGRSGDVPESSSLLCEALCQMLLHRREAEAGIDMSKFPTEYRNLNYMQKRMLVKRVAHYMVKNHASTLDARTADQVIARTLERFPHQQGSDGRSVRTALVERGGVLREALQGKLDFIHNTIKEYLAAEQFVDNQDAGLLVAQAFDANWWPVITFAAASTNCELRNTTN